MEKSLVIISAILLTCLFGLGLIQENIWRNRKLGADPKTKQWHQMQWIQTTSFFIGISVAGWHYWLWLYELPLTALLWILFQGFTNLYTFGRPWGYVGNKADIDNHGSAIDRWFLRKDHPEKAMKMAQATTLLLSLLPLVLYYALFH